jgi:branched-chain amino acid aminotransferase
MEIRFVPADSLKAKPADETKLGFGKIFTDHMFEMDYSVEKGWHDPRVTPFHNFELSPAAMVLHYSQTIFEGLKLYRTQEGFQLFRPRDNFKRMNVSAERMAIPAFDVETAMAGLLKLLEVEKEWTPSAPGTSLYIRPTIIATDPFVGVRSGYNYKFFIILSPVGAYYASGLSPVGIYVEDKYVRAVRGGVGFAKTGGNYASSLKAGDVAKEKGYAQVMWLDGIEQKYVEEVGSMNMMFVIGGKVVTPMLNGSILSGITRDSVLTLAKDAGLCVEERKISIDEVVEGAKTGLVTEAFGTGTAAVVSPVGTMCYGSECVTFGDGSIGKFTQRFYDTLTGIQYGRLPDPHNWIVKL